MSAADVAQIIQLIIAPVVLITACALIQNGALSRYGSVGQSIRSLTHERLDLLRSPRTTDEFFLERLHEIDRQLPLLIRRHRLLQNASLILYGSIVIFLLTMFAIALSVGLSSGGVATFALLLFIGGTAVLTVGVFLISSEVRMSHHAICYEVSRVIALKRQSEFIVEG